MPILFNVDFLNQVHYFSMKYYPIVVTNLEISYSSPNPFTKNSKVDLLVGIHTCRPTANKVITLLQLLLAGPANSVPPNS